jgi:hypothetical protein
MYVLRIEHGVPDFAAWKAAFDADPIGRKQSGVSRYRVLRAVDDPNHVMIDLEFPSEEAADRAHVALTELWGRVTVMRDPHARLVELVESKEF